MMMLVLRATVPDKSPSARRTAGGAKASIRKRKKRCCLPLRDVIQGLHWTIGITESCKKNSTWSVELNGGEARKTERILDERFWEVKENEKVGLVGFHVQSNVGRPSDS
jgi:hypothetical protein